MGTMSMRGSVLGVSAIILGALSLAACGGSADANGSSGDTSVVEVAPSELVINGRRYVRMSALSQAELDAMKDPALWEPPETVEKLEQLLRGWISHYKYGDYVEAEPNRELARISLGLDPSPRGLQGGNEAPPDGVRLVEKTITSNGDQRTVAVSTTTNPGNAYALSESGGTGTMVGWRIYTAGHVIYNNVAVPGTDGWTCRDNSTTPFGTEPSCSTAGHPRWRFGGKITVSNGVETQTWATPWVLCGFKNVPTGWRNLPSGSSGTTLARWDYGVQNLDGCIPSGAGNVGWWTIDQATLRLRTTFQGGYPALQPCPAGAIGNSTGSSDCPGGSVRLRPNTSTRPYTGGTLYWTSGGSSDPNLILTGGYIQSSKFDVTAGHSGGSIIALDGSQWWSVGCASNTALGQFNTNYNAMTSEVVNFLYQ
ncbi:MAG: hypothetical protein ACOY0T_31870 [Myxococcota bacterium]